MVRKRAQAQKALSPPRETESKYIDSNDIEDEEEEEEEERPNKRLKIDEESNSSDNNDNGIEVININKGACSPAILDNEFDQLQSHEMFSKELSDEAKGYWHTVMQDYQNFSNWTCLLQHITDSEDNIEAARASYNCFLRYYPYCYGYWKKFADIEKKNGNIDKAKEIFEHGVQAISISVDLWVHYINFSIHINKGVKENQSIIRSLFKRAIDAAGMEFKSTKLWEAFIDWERTLGNLRNVTEIFDQLITTPTHQYIKNWQKFKTHLEAYSPGEFLPAKEYGKLMKEMDVFPPGMVIDEDKAPGEEEGELSPGSPSIPEDDNLKETYVEVRKKVLMDRESIFRETSQEIVKRWRYEESIKRPYFHVKPLEKTQIKNWKDYLDYELKQGNHKRIVFLFERCVVVCAMYDFFWEKYLDYIETKDVEQARTVFQRACTIHLIKKYKLHMRWATFEEREKNHRLAAAILRRIDINFPGMILLTQRRVGLARRTHQYDEVVSIYEQAIDAVDRIEDKIFYSIKFSHVLVKFCNKKAQARHVLWSALELGKKHKRIYLQLLDLETHYGSVEMDFVKKLFNSIQNDMSVDDDFRESCAQRKVEFYVEYGDDIDEILSVQESYLEEQKQPERKKDMRESLKTKRGERSMKEDEVLAHHHHQQQHQQQQHHVSSRSENMHYPAQQQSWYPPKQSNYDWQSQQNQHHHQQHYGHYSQYNHQQ